MFYRIGIIGSLDWALKHIATQSKTMIVTQTPERTRLIGLHVEYGVDNIPTLEEGVIGDATNGAT